MNHTAQTIPFCPEHNTGGYFVPTPDLIHWGKFVCPTCEKFLAWAKAPSDVKPRAKNYIIGGTKFKSKTAVIDYVKETIAGTEPGAALSAERFCVIRELLDYHPEAEIKIGCGVERIEVRMNPEFGKNARGFWIVRVDSSETDFSYKKCLDGEKAYRNQFIRACRFAVKDHIEEFRFNFFATATSPHCALTGKAISEKSSHVDHIPPHTFERIVAAFATLNAIQIDDPALCEHGIDGLLLPTFASELLRDKFIHFHNTHAQLRVISADANMTLVRTGSESKEKKDESQNRIQQDALRLQTGQGIELGRIQQELQER